MLLSLLLVQPLNPGFGSLVYALSLVALSQCWNLASFLVCWAAIGFASGLALSTPASIALVQVAGPRARQAISLLTIIAGLSSTIFWPLTGVLDAALGWRATLLAFAAMHVLICLPVHFLLLPRRPPVHPTNIATAASTSDVSPNDHSRVYLLLSVSLTFGAFVFTGAQLQMIELLRGLGHPPASALLIASLIGPAQVGTRIFELFFGHRYTIMKAAVLGSTMLPVGLGLALLAGNVFAVGEATHGIAAKLVNNMMLGIACLQRKIDGGS